VLNIPKLDSEIQYKIKENSLRARMAALKLKEPKVAMVWGSTILLFGVSQSEFLKNNKWVKHELEHVRQFKQHGFFTFLLKYTLETLQKGYRNNRFEIAARAAENK
jgi:hypothetical protein